MWSPETPRTTSSSPPGTAGRSRPQLPAGRLQPSRRRRRSRRVDRWIPSGPLSRGVHPHELRHTAASLAAKQGAKVSAAQKMLGHSSAKMTLDTYTHLFDDELEGVAGRFARPKAWHQSGTRSTRLKSLISRNAVRLGELIEPPWRFELRPTHYEGRPALTADDGWSWFRLSQRRLAQSVVGCIWLRGDMPGTRESSPRRVHGKALGDGSRYSRPIDDPRR